MAEEHTSTEDSVTMVGCPYGDKIHGKHVPTYLCIIDGKVKCANEAIKTFRCKREGLKCTVRNLQQDKCTCAFVSRFNMPFCI